MPNHLKEPGSNSISDVRLLNLIQNSWRYLGNNPLIFLTFFVYINALLVRAGSISREGLVAYYNFEDGGATDESGNGFNGIVVDAEIVETEDEANNINLAYYFNGKASIYGPASLPKISFPNQERTVAFRFMPLNSSALSFFLFGYGGRADVIGSSFFIALNNCNKREANSSDQVYEIQSHNGVKLVTYTDNSNYGAKNEWKHFGMTTSYHGGTAIYLNGEEVAKYRDEFFDNTLVPGSIFALGASVSPDGSSVYRNDCVPDFIGYLDDVVIYKKVLIKSEMKSLAANTTAALIDDTPVIENNNNDAGSANFVIPAISGTLIGGVIPVACAFAYRFFNRRRQSNINANVYQAVQQEVGDEHEKEPLIHSINSNP